MQQTSYRNVPEKQSVYLTLCSYVSQFVFKNAKQLIGSFILALNGNCCVVSCCAVSLSQFYVQKKTNVLLDKLCLQYTSTRRPKPMTLLHKQQATCKSAPQRCPASCDVTAQGAAAGLSRTTQLQEPICDPNRDCAMVSKFREQNVFALSSRAGNNTDHPRNMHIHLSAVIAVHDSPGAKPRLPLSTPFFRILKAAISCFAQWFLVGQL